MPTGLPVVAMGACEATPRFLARSYRGVMHVPTLRAMTDPATPPPAPQRERIDCDIVIVGAGPAGLAAAIRVKQLDPAASVVVFDNHA